VFRLIVLTGILVSGACDQVCAAEIGRAVPDSLKETVSPRGALLRSMVLPGWGQFYNGRPFKGSLYAAVEAGSVVAFFMRRNQLKDRSSMSGTPERNVYLFTSIGIALVSMADAYVDAHLDSVDWGNVEVSPDEKGKMKVMFRVRF
jgi:hypothetical protein